MSASISTGVVRMASKIVVKREPRKGFVQKPDALVASLIAHKNSIARRATKAREEQDRKGSLSRSGEEETRARNSVKGQQYKA
jgi:hypothetical protein